MQPDQAATDKWSVSAAYWEKYREVILQMFAPVTDALIEEARVGTGNSVLDVGTGPGEPALTIAARVGPAGKVTGIDPAQEMVAVARRATVRQGMGNAQFEVAGADNLPFPDHSFDAAVSRFGAMFFPSPVAAAREILRVLKPGRKMALAVWGRVDENPFFDAIQRVVDRHVDAPPAAPNAPDAFRFASRGELRKILDEAGVTDSSERLLRFRIEAPISAEQFWTMRCEMSETLREKIAKIPAERLTEVRQQGLEALRPYSTDGGMSFPSSVLIVGGAKAISA